MTDYMERTNPNIHSSEFMVKKCHHTVVAEGIYLRHGKRLLDVAWALVLLAVFLPVIVIVAVGVWRTGAPVLFGHRRVGRRGAEFRCLKFSSMVPDAETRLQELLARDPVARQQWDENHKLDNDPRITRFGHLLRKSSMDELPQLWNVLVGDMSLVGPRPVTAEELSRYGKDSKDYLRLRPGLTGRWQVGGRNDVTYDERVAMDCAYAREVGLMTDLAILLRTVGVVLSRNGR